MIPSWIGEACRQRERAGQLSLRAVARVLQTHATTVKRARRNRNKSWSRGGPQLRVTARARRGGPVPG